MKNEPEKLLINNNLHNKRQKEQISIGSSAVQERNVHKVQSQQEYKKLNSEDNEHKVQIAILGRTDIYAEKMKIRIPDATFDDNIHNEKSHNSVRVNSIHHKLKEEDEVYEEKTEKPQYDENGQQQRNSFVEENKENAHEEFKNRTRSERDELLIGGNNEENEHGDLLEMDYAGNENPNANADYENGDENNKEKEAFETNNYDKDMQDLVNEEENEAAAGGEQATPDNGEANAAENAEENEHSYENKQLDANNENKEGDNVIEKEKDNNENNENNNAEEASGNKGETLNEEDAAAAEEAEKPAENAEFNDNQCEKAEVEGNTVAVEHKPEGDAQPENPENPAVENAENKEDSPQE